MFSSLRRPIPFGLSVASVEGPRFHASFRSRPGLLSSYQRLFSNPMPQGKKHGVKQKWLPKPKSEAAHAPERDGPFGSFQASAPLSSTALGKNPARYHSAVDERADPKK